MDMTSYFINKDYIGVMPFRKLKSDNNFSDYKAIAKEFIRQKIKGVKRFCSEDKDSVLSDYQMLYRNFERERLFKEWIKDEKERVGE